MPNPVFFNKMIEKSLYQAKIMLEMGDLYAAIDADNNSPANEGNPHNFGDWVSTLKADIQIAVGKLMKVRDFLMTKEQEFPDMFANKQGEISELLTVSEKAIAQWSTQ
jgi:hypothetical protein